MKDLTRKELFILLNLTTCKIEKENERIGLFEDINNDNEKDKALNIINERMEELKNLEKKLFDMIVEDMKG